MLRSASSSRTRSLSRSSCSQETVSRCIREICCRQFSPACLRCTSPTATTRRSSSSRRFCSSSLPMYSRRSRIRMRSLPLRARVTYISVRSEACSRISTGVTRSVSISWWIRPSMAPRSPRSTSSSAISLSRQRSSPSSSPTGTLTFPISSSYSTTNCISTSRCSRSLLASSTHSASRKSPPISLRKSSCGCSGLFSFEFMIISKLPTGAGRAGGQRQIDMVWAGCSGITQGHGMLVCDNQRGLYLFWISKMLPHQVLLMISVVKSYLRGSSASLCGSPLGTQPSRRQFELRRASARPKTTIMRWMRRYSVRLSMREERRRSLPTRRRARSSPPRKQVRTRPVSARFQLLTTWGKEGELTMTGQGFSLSPVFPPRMQLFRFSLKLCTHPNRLSCEVQDINKQQIIASRPASFTKGMNYQMASSRCSSCTSPESCSNWRCRAMFSSSVALIRCQRSLSELSCSWFICIPSVSTTSSRCTTQLSCREPSRSSPCNASISSWTSRASSSRCMRSLRPWRRRSSSSSSHYCQACREDSSRWAICVRRESSFCSMSSITAWMRSSSQKPLKQPSLLAWSPFLSRSSRTSYSSRIRRYFSTFARPLLSLRPCSTVCRSSCIRAASRSQCSNARWAFCSMSSSKVRES